MLTNVGKDDYGFLGYMIPAVSILVEKHMKSDVFTFVWNPNADLSLVAQIPEATFVTRVLGNIKRNIIQLMTN